MIIELIGSILLTIAILYLWNELSKAGLALPY